MLLCLSLSYLTLKDTDIKIKKGTGSDLNIWPEGKREKDIRNAWKLQWNKSENTKLEKYHILYTDPK